MDRRRGADWANLLATPYGDGKLCTTMDIGNYRGPGFVQAYSKYGNYRPFVHGSGRIACIFTFNLVLN